MQINVRPPAAVTSARAATSDGDTAMSDDVNFDAYKPAEIARRVQAAGVEKVRLAFLPLLTLAVLAGAFIAMGAAFYTLTVTGNVLGFGVGRLVGGVAFSLGLILVVIAGAELFTGNNLIVVAWADRRVAAPIMLRNWAIVYAGNLLGALATVAIVYAGAQYEFGDGSVGVAALTAAETKTSLGFGQAVALGMMCNALVCLAVWLSYSARSVTDKVLAVIFPITAFVAAGFEHSVANMYFIPLGILLKDRLPAGGAENLSWPGLFSNLLPVTLGNIIGGGVMVALVYYFVYRYSAKD